MSALLRALMGQSTANAPKNLAVVTQDVIDFESLTARHYFPTGLRARKLNANALYNVELDYTVDVMETSGTSNTYIFADKKSLLSEANKPLRLARIVTEVPTSESGHVSVIVKARKDVTDLDNIVDIDAEKSKGRVSITNLVITEV